MDGTQLLRQAVEPLLKWYRLCKRTLPWRENKDPYRVWISEIMLQQTRVEAVKGYYLRFLERFPTVHALAAADTEEVLKYWEGLGYYTRARNLHKAAKQIAEHGFPDTFEGVRALAGIGDYTAGAILSIAFDKPCPAVDGNVIRVLTRLSADGRSLDDRTLKADLTARLKEVYPAEAGDFCQALMELGALVCVPNGAPTCGACPWQRLCRAHAEGREEAYPVRKEKPARRVEEFTVLVLERSGRFALEKREESGLLAGLWQFPLFAGTADPEGYGSVRAKKSAVHIFTHVEWRMTGYLVSATEEFPAYRWFTAEEIREKYAVPSAFKAFLPWLKGST